MSIPNYVLGYPPDGSSLGNTKLQIRNNLDGTFLTLSVDHRNANQTNPGYHTVIHSLTQSSDPSVFSGGSQYYSKIATIPPGGHSVPFVMASDGTIFQMIGRSPVTDGYFWSAGMLIQWGTSTTASNTTITFPVVFPTAIFNIQCTIFQNTTNRHFVYARSSNTTSFITTQLDSNGVAETSTFSWMAIGW
jgi:hypothetical protein